MWIESLGASSDLVLGDVKSKGSKEDWKLTAKTRADLNHLVKLVEKAKKFALENC